MNNWGAIFDWDGVIVDSSRQHLLSWERLAAEVGLPLPDDHFKRSFGMKNQTIIPRILRWSDQPELVQKLSDRKEELYRDIIRETGIEPLPGVEDWLTQLSEAGVACAVGSSTDRANIEMILTLVGLRKRFVGIVSSEDVSRGKPEPDVFLKAAALLDLPPERCVVFEDAPVGVEAGRAAGCRVVAVAGSRDASALSCADLTVSRLDEIPLAEVATWFNGVGVEGGART